MSDLLTKKKFSSPLDQAFVAANWQRRGYSCNQFVDPPGQEWLNFTHETDELAAVVEGQLELTIGSEKIEMNPGDAVFIPAKALHSVVNTHDGVTCWLFGYN